MFKGTHITARCAHCQHDGPHPAGSFELFRCFQDSTRDYYTFRCAGCGQANTRRADLQIAAILIGAQVRVTPYRLPAEIADPQRSQGEALRMDDLLDFIGQLQSWDGELTA